MLNLQSISHTHPDKELLFSNINLTVADHEKIALVGNNGTGKSTLLKIIAGELQPSGGQIILNTKPYFVPQIFGQFNHLTIAQALLDIQNIEILTTAINQYHGTLIVISHDEMFLEQVINIGRTITL